MFLARMVFFRLHESPRYLVHAGRPQEAIESLQLISKFNGSHLSLALEDVDDQKPQPVASRRLRGDNQERDDSEDSTPFLRRKSSAENAASEEPQGNRIDPPPEIRETIFDAEIVDYSSTGQSSTALGAHVFATPTTEFNAPASLIPGATDVADRKLNPAASTDQVAPMPQDQPSHVAVDIIDSHSQRRPQIAARRRSHRLSHRTSSIYEKKVCWMLPRWLRRPLWAWWDRVMMVLAPEWLRTTLLVWGAWWGMSLGMFHYLSNFSYSFFLL